MTDKEENSDKDGDSQTIPTPQDLTNKIPGINPVIEPQKNPIGPDLPFTNSWSNNKPINPKPTMKSWETPRASQEKSVSDHYSDDDTTQR